MIKNRSFLFGLGTGLITGALLLQLMISGGAAPLTKEQVLQGAEKLNMKVIDEAAVPSSGETENDNKEEVTETGGRQQKARRTSAPLRRLLQPPPRRQCHLQRLRALIKPLRRTSHLRLLTARLSSQRSLQRPVPLQPL